MIPRRVRTQEAKIKLGTDKESWQIQLDWFFARADVRCSTVI